MTKRIRKGGLSGQVGPAINQCRMAKATKPHWPSYAHLYAKGTEFGVIDLKSLERNKYAPWGRGEASGLPV